MIFMRKGVSELVSMVLVTLITVVGIASVTLWGKPALDAAGDAALLNEAQRNMAILDGMVRQAAAEGNGVLKRSVIGVTDGTYRVNGTSNSLEYEAEPRSDGVPRSFLSDGKVRLNVTYDDISLSGGMRIGKGRHSVCVEKTADQPEVSVKVSSC